jgi:hypothetical protein
MTKSSVAAVFDELSLADEIVEVADTVTNPEAEIIKIEEVETGQEEPVKMDILSSRWEDKAGKLVCRWVFED